MKSRYYLTVTLLAVCLQANSASVEVFGLPLGGKLQHDIPKCRLMGQQPDSYCGVGKKIRATTRNASYSVGTPLMPEWVSYEPPELYFDKEGNLAQIKLRAHPSKIRAAVHSISLRFGSAKQASDEGGISLAIWHNDDLDISLACQGDYCLAIFTSAAMVAEQNARIAARPKRPITP